MKVVKSIGGLVKKNHGTTCLVNGEFVVVVTVTCDVELLASLG